MNQTVKNIKNPIFELEANSFDGFNAIKDTLSDIN